MTDDGDGLLEASIERERVRRRRALDALLQVVRESGIDWRDLLEHWIDNAALRTLLVLDNGLVRADVADVPKLDDVPLDVGDRAAELRRRRAEDHARVLGDPEALTTRVADQREAAALNIVLEGGHAQSHAMHALVPTWLSPHFFW